MSCDFPGPGHTDRVLQDNAPLADWEELPDGPTNPVADPAAALAKLARQFKRGAPNFQLALPGGVGLVFPP